MQGQNAQGRDSNDGLDDVNLRRQMTEVLGVVLQMSQMVANSTGNMRQAEPRGIGQEVSGSRAPPEVARERAAHQSAKEDQELASRMFVSQRATHIEDEGGMERKTSDGTVLPHTVKIEQEVAAAIAANSLRA